MIDPDVFVKEKFRGENESLHTGEASIVITGIMKSVVEYRTQTQIPSHRGMMESLVLAAAAST